MFQIVSTTALLLLILATTACEIPSTGSGSNAIPVGPPIVNKVSRENYLSGRQFCSKYSEITSNEYGKRIQVPAFYAEPEKGFVEIYAYTLRAFNPNLPSYIFVDGGPGQNTHGIKDVTDGKFNEIRFDQRGLGCSAPENFDLYLNPKFYSTENTVKDMDAIRAAYGIKHWAAYGISYGTVPATQYGSVYPETTKSVVLEGIVGRSGDIHQWSYKASKINIILSQLSLGDREAFHSLMSEGSEDTQIVMSVLFGFSFYQDFGLREAKRLLGYFIQGGEIQREFLRYVRESSREQNSGGVLPPQQPGGIDENVMKILYCRELNYRDLGKTALTYSRDQGFVAIPAGGIEAERECDQIGVPTEAQVPYQIEQFQVHRPVYYFQGSHDGATMARGAWNHWNVVPQAGSYFLLAQKGGHNPNLTRLMAKDNLGLKMQQSGLFQKALNAEEITASDVEVANLYAKSEQKWKFWNSPVGAQAEFDQELEGIRSVMKLGLLQ